MVDRVNEDTRNATAAQEGQEASMTDSQDSGTPQSGTPEFSDSVAQLAQNEPENTGDNQGDGGEGAPENPQELISQALAVLAELGFDVEDGIDLEDPAVVAALQDAGFNIDQLVLAVAEVTGEQIEPAAGPEAGPGAVAAGGGDRFAPTEAGDIGDGIGISGLLGPRDLTPSPLEVEGTGFGDALALDISVSVQTDIEGEAALGLYEDWQPIQAESQDPGGSSGFTDADTDFDTQMYETLRTDDDYTPFDSLGNPGEDFLFPGNLVFDITAEPDTIDVDYGPLEISGAPAGSYLFYVDGDTIQRFDFVDGTETFTLSDVSEDYLEGSNIFILPPEDSDVDFTLDVSLDAEALGQEVTFTGDVPVVLDAVADLPEIDAGGEGSNLDGDTFYFNEDHSLEGGEGGEGGEGYYPPIFDQEVPLNLQGQEFEGNDFPHEFPGEYGPCYQGWTPSFEPTYNLPFSTAITDRDLAIGRDEPSEGLIRVTLGLSENPENNTEVASALPEFGQYDEDGGQNFYASIGGQRLDSDSLSEGGLQVAIFGQYWSEATGLQSGEIQATVTMNEGGQLVFTDFQVEGEGGDSLEGPRVQEIDFSNFDVTLPQHADNDLQFDVFSTSRELRADGLPDGELTFENNEATSQETYDVQIRAVADGAKITVTLESYREIEGNCGAHGVCEWGNGDEPQAAYAEGAGYYGYSPYGIAFAEDGEVLAQNHGEDSTESPLQIPMHFTASLIDQDGSESVTQFTVSLSGAAEGTHFVDADGNDLTDGQTITIDGVEGTVSLDGGSLTVDFGENAVPGQNLDVTGEMGIELPIDSSDDFRADISVTTAETDPTNPDAVALSTKTTHTQIDFDIKGVAGPADAGFGEYDGDCLPVYGAGSESVVSDLSDDGSQTGVKLTGLAFGAYTAGESLDLESLAAGENVTFDPNGAGVLVDGEDRGLEVPDQVGHDPEADASEALVATLDDPASSVTVTVSNLFSNEDQGEYGEVTLYNPDGEALGTVLFGSSSDAPAGYDGVYQQVAFNEGSNNVGTITLEASELCEGDAIGALAFQAAPYGGAVSEGDAQASDSSDYFVRELDYTKAVVEEYRFAEDGETSSAAHGGDSETARLIDVKYAATTQDDDGSEGITQIVLNKGESDGSWVDTTGETQALGDELVLGDGSVWSVSEDGSELTLTFERYEGQSEDGEYAGPTSVDLAGKLGIELPVDDSTDFTLTGKAKTQEYDDDGFAGDGAYRELIDGWQECNGCGDKTEWTDTSSVSFKVEGVVAEAADAGFGEYDGDCLPVYGAGSESVVSDLSDDGSQTGVKLTGLAFGAYTAGESLDLESLAAGENVTFDPNGAGVLVDGEDRGLEVPDQVGHDPEADASEALVATLDDPASSVTVTVSNLFSNEDQGEYGEVTLYNPDGEALGTVLFGSSSDAPAGYDGVYQQVAFNEGSNNVGTITLEASELCEGDAIGALAFQAAPYGGAVSEGDAQASDSSDYFVRELDYTKAVVEEYRFAEDGETSSAAHGGDSETARLIDVKYAATTQDDDGSEGITQIVLNKGESDGSWVDTTGETQALGDELVLGDGSVWSVSEDGSELTLTFERYEGQSEDGEYAGPTSVDLAGKLGIELPVDDSTDFTLTGKAKTQEYDDDGFAGDGAYRELIDGWQECNGCGDKTEWTDTSSVSFKVEGVVAEAADAGFGEYDGDCLPVYGAGSESVVSDLSDDGSQTGVKLTGLAFGAYTAGESLDLESLAAGENVTFDPNGAGVLVDGEDRGLEVPDQVGHDPEADASEALVATLDDPASSVTVTVSNLFSNEDQGEYGEVTLYNPDGEALGTVLFGSSSDAPAGYDGVYQQVAFNEGSNNVGTITLEASELCEGDAIGALAFQAAPYGGAVSEGDAQASDSSDYFVRELDYTKAVVEEYRFAEDGETSSAAHGGDSETARLIDVKYAATTQDDDGSEGITQIVLNKGESDGSWVDTTGETQALGDELVLGDGSVWSVSEDGSELTLTFERYEGQSEDGEYAGPTSVDLAGKLGIELPVDDSTDFTLTGKAKTQEYDDDGFAGDGAYRELIDGWQECNGCGDKTEWTDTSSVSFKVEGVVAEAADAGFGEYDGDCLPVYGAGSESVVSDLSDDGSQTGVKLTGLAFGAYTAGESLDLESLAAGENVTFDPNGAGVLVDGEDRGLEVPDQVGHDPEADASEALVATLDDPASSVTVTVSNLFSNEDQGEYGEVTLYNPDGEALGTVLFGSSSDAPAGYDGVYQQVAFNEGSNNVGTITLEASELCEGDAIGALAFQAAPYGGAVSEGDAQASDSSDYFVRELDYTKAVVEEYRFAEDGETSSAAHGGDSETARLIDVKYAATTQDDDGSEGITQIVLNKGESDGSWVDTTGETQALGDELVLGDGSVWSVSEDGSELTLTFERYEGQSEDGEYAGPTSVDLAGKLGIELPVDDSTDFTLTGKAKTQEYDDDGFAGDGAYRELIDGWQECNGCGDKTEWTDTSSVSFKVEGVVAEAADAGFGEYDGDCLPVYGAGSESVVSDLSDDGSQTGVKLTGLAFGAYTAGESLDLESLAAGENVTFDPNGAGVLVDGEDRGLEVPDQVGHDPEADASEALVATLDDPASSVTVTVSNLFSNEDQGEYGEVTLYNPDGEALGTVLFGSSSDAPAGYDGVYQQVAFNEGSNNVGTITLEASELCEGDAIGALAFQAAPYGGAVSEGDAQASDSSDYFVRELDYTKAVVEEYRFAEDGETSSAAHGGDSETARLIDVKYAATTQDDDGSEGITQIVLNKGESDGSWVDTTGETQALGDELVLGDGSVWSVSEDGSELTLTFERYEGQSEDGEYAGPTSVDLAGKLGIELPVDDSTDFTLTGKAKTQEYDDDGFAGDGAYRELIDGWQECNGCGDKTEWTDTSSVSFKVEGVVAEAADAGFGEYDGDCLPVYGAGSESVVSDLSDDGSQTGVKLTGLAFGAYTAGESLDLESLAAGENVTFDPNGAGVLVDGEDRGLEVPDQVGHDPEADASEALVATLDDPASSVTVTVSNLFSNEDQGEYGEVTLYNPDGEALGTVLFGSSSDAPAGYDGVYQQVAFNEGSNNVGTITLEASELCEGDAIGALAFQAAPYGGAVSEGDAQASDSSDYFVRELDYTKAVVEEYRFAEDGETSSAAHGGDSETARLIDVKYAATTQDDDGSEGITQIVLNKGESDGSWVDTTGETQALGDELVLGDGSVWSVSEDGSELTLTFERYEGQSEDGEYAGPTSVDLAGKLGIELPVDDSTDFTLTGKAKTQEYDDDGFAGDGAYRELIDGWQECNGCGDKTEWTDTSSVSFKVEGVVAEAADAGFGEYDGDCLPVYGAGSESVVSDLSDDGSQTGVKLTGLAFGAYTAGESLDLESLAAGENVTFDPNGAGVLVDGEDRGLEVPDQVGHDPEADASEALVATLDDPASSVTVTVSNLFSNEDQGEYGEVTLYNPDGEALGTVLFGSSSDAPAGYDGVYQQVAFNEGSNNVGTITLEASELCEGDAIGALAFQAAPYGGAVSEGDAQASDSSDYFVRELDYTKAVVEEYRFAEDGETSSAAHGGDSETARLIDVKYAATTQDDDGSEGITQIVLNKGESDGSWVDTTGETQALGDELVLGDGSVWSVSEDGSELTLTFERYEGQSEDGEYAGPTSVDLAGKLGIELPVDDSTDFTLTGKAKTQEYDDDGFAGDGAYRELIDGWQECNGCGDKTEWTDTSSVSFKVEGVVAEAADAGFGEYDGDCLPVYGAGSESVVSDLSDDGSQTGVKLTGLAFGAYTAGESLDLESLAAGENVTFDPNGAGVLVDGEDRGLEVPDQVGHDPEADASEALVATLDDPASSVTVTVSNLFSNEDQGEYGEVTLYNPDGEALGTVLFGSSSDAPAGYDGVYQQVAFNEGSNNVGTITLEASELCEGDAIGALAFQAAPYGGAVSEGDAQASDSSDYFVRELDYTKAVVEEYRFAEDGETSSAAHGGDSETARLIDVKYAATTQDDDGSEGITQIVLNKGESDGSWVDTTGETQALGDELVLGDGSVWSVSEDGSELTLTFERYEGQSEDGEYAGPTSVDLAGKLGIELPVDDSTDFTLTGKAKTQEYDDDGFAGDGAYRELIDGWQECNGCGDKTEWTDTSSVSFKVEGVVAEAAETGFGSYAGACAPIIVGGEAVSAGASEWLGTQAAYRDSWQDVDGISLSAKDGNGEVVFRGPGEGPNAQVSAPGAFGVGIDGGSIDEVDGPEILRVDFDGPGAASVDVGLSMFYGGEIGTEQGTITVYGENDEVLGTIEISGEQDSYPNSAGLLDLSIGQKDLDTKGAIKALEFEAGEPGDNNDQSDLFLQSLSYEKAELDGWVFSEDGEKSSSEHGYKVDESSLVIPVKYSASAEDDDGSEGIFKIALGKGESDGDWIDQSSGEKLEAGDEVTIAGQTWTVGEEDGQLVLTYDEGENADGSHDVAAPTSVDLSGVIGIKLPIDDSTDFTLEGQAWTREYDDDAFEDLDARTLKGDWEEICAECADQEAESSRDSIEIKVEGVAGAAKTWFAGDTDYQSPSGGDNALQIPLNHVAKTKDDDGSEGITRLSLSLGAGLSGATWLKDGQEVLADTSVELTDQKTDKEYTFNVKEISGDQLVLELDSSDYPGPEKVDLADDGFKFELPEGYSGDFTLNIDTTTTEFDDDAFDDLSERKLASDWQEICGDCGDKTATVSDKIGFQIEEPANTPPQADRVDTQALAVCEIDGSQANQLEGIINHLGDGYDVVAARPLSINDVIDGEDSGNDDVTLGGLDSESDLADLTFRITEAPDRGFLVIEDESGNYTIIDDSTDLTDDNNSTFSSTAKIWWLGEKDDVYEEGAEASTDGNPTLSGNTGTWELDGSGKVDLRGLKKAGSDWVESGLTHNPGNGLAVSTGSAAQVDDDERVEISFNQAVNQAQFTLKPFNGVPEENGIAWSIFDEDGTKIDSGVDNPSDGPNGSTAIFNFQSDQPFHKIWIGPAEGDNGESAKFGIKDFSFVPVEEKSASFKYEVEDEGGLTSDPATVTIDPADGSCKIDLGTPEDATVFEKGLPDGSENGSAAIMAADKDLGIDDPVETVLSFTENQPWLDGLQSSDVPVDIEVSGDGKTLTGKANGGDVFTVTLNDDGTYTFDLHEDLDHDYGDDGHDNLDLKFNFKAEKDGNSQIGEFKVTVEDDVPNAVDDSASTETGLPKPVNLTLVLDRSNSMNETANGGSKTRLEQMQSAAQSLISSFAAAGVALKLNIIGFNTEADTLYDGTDISQANDIIGNMQADGGTHYANALNLAKEQIELDINDPAFEGYEQKVYFISDADESQGSQSSTYLDLPDDDAWQDFVAEHGLDVTAAGIGTESVQEQLKKIASEDDKALENIDPDNLEATLLATIGGEPVQGDLLANDVFGADGPKDGDIEVSGVQIVGDATEPDDDSWVTYTTDGDSDDDTIIITTDKGELKVYQDGSYEFTASDNAPVGSTESFFYQIKDGDGDTAWAKLDINIQAPAPVAHDNQNSLVQSLPGTEEWTFDDDLDGWESKGNAKEKSNEAWMSTDSTEKSDGKIEDFLGLTNNSLTHALDDYLGYEDTPNEAIEGSAISKGEVHLKGGDQVAFDWRFESEDTNFDYVDDFGVFTISGNDESHIEVLSSADDGSNQSGSRTFTVPEDWKAGKYTLGFAVMDDVDDIGKSELFIDRVEVTRTPAAVSGNVIEDPNNDYDDADYGKQDRPADGELSKVVYDDGSPDGVEHLFGGNDFVEITTNEGGLLNIWKDGDYTYEAPSGLSEDLEEKFTYTLETENGQKTTANLTINVSAGGPQAYNNAAVVGQSSNSTQVIYESDFSNGYEHYVDGWTEEGNAYEYDYKAVMRTDDYPQNAEGHLEDIEDGLLGLPEGTLQSETKEDKIEEGSGIRRDFEDVKIGDTVSFDWYFETDENDKGNEDDVAVFTVVDESGNLEHFEVLTSAHSDLNDGDDKHDPRWAEGSFTHTFQGDGDYKVGFAVLDVQNRNGNSRLEIDNVEWERPDINTVSGNVIDDPNHDPGDIANYGKEDTPSDGVITEIGYKDETLQSVNGTTTLTSKLGEKDGYLEIDENGSYTYVASSGLSEDQTETFTYTLRDEETGQTSTADLTIDVRKDGVDGDYQGGFNLVDEISSGNDLIGETGENNLIDASSIGQDVDLIGQEKDDVLIGGLGKNDMTGNGGADTFVFTEDEVMALLDNPDDFNTITDFNNGNDSIDLSSLSDVLYDQENLIGNVHMDDDGNLSVDVKGDDGNKETVKVAEVTDSSSSDGSISSAQVYVDDNNSENIA